MFGHLTCKQEQGIVKEIQILWHINDTEHIPHKNNKQQKTHLKVSLFCSHFTEEYTLLLKFQAL